MEGKFVPAGCVVRAGHKDTHLTLLAAEGLRVRRLAHRVRAGS
jgi:hypothetical protein